MYKFKASEHPRRKLKVNLFGSGAIMNEVLAAQKQLEEKYNISASVYSVTSYKELRRDGLEVDR